MSGTGDKPSDAPEHCPGTGSEDAGKVSACAGCPNQSLCASGATRGPDPGAELVKAKMSRVKNKIVILSGKGGVGKSTVTSLVARALAARFPDKHVGLVDIDICGPSQPRIMGVLDEEVHQSGSGWCPVMASFYKFDMDNKDDLDVLQANYVEENLALISVGFLLGSPDEAVIWRGPKKNNMIRQLLSETDWEETEWLLMDAPPGTSDEHLSSAAYLKPTGRTYALLVTTPPQLALLDVRKEIDFCRKAGLEILGLVENMSPFICPHCKSESEVFPAGSEGGAEGMCAELGLQLLGRLPLVPSLAQACDEGTDPLSLPYISQPLQAIIDKILVTLESR